MVYNGYRLFYGFSPYSRDNMLFPVPASNPNVFIPIFFWDSREAQYNSPRILEWLMQNYRIKYEILSNAFIYIDDSPSDWSVESGWNELKSGLSCMEGSNIASFLISDSKLTLLSGFPGQVYTCDFNLVEVISEPHALAVAERSRVEHPEFSSEINSWVAWLAGVPFPAAY